MLIVGSTRKVDSDLVEETPQNDSEDDTGIKEIYVENTKVLTRTAKIVVVLKFKEHLPKLKEFIAKLQIYISCNNNSFDKESDKVLFAISYLEDTVFDFIKVYLDDFSLYINYLKKIKPNTQTIFKDINKFIKVIREVYRELCKQEKATRQLVKL